MKIKYFTDTDTLYVEFRLRIQPVSATFYALAREGGCCKWNTGRGSTIRKLRRR